MPKSLKVLKPLPAARHAKLALRSNLKEKSSKMPHISPGRYRHYKGNEYLVLGVARHSETQEELVVYRQQYGDFGLWVRPKQMFVESVMVDGQEVPRCRYSGDTPAS